MGAKDKAERGNVVFRRIRGRLVPIRRKGPKQTKKQKNILKGSGLIGLGLSTAAAGGAIAGKLFKSGTKSAFRADLANKQLDMLSKMKSTHARRFFQSKAIETGARNLKKTKFKFGLSKGAFRLGTTVLGAAIVGEGISTISKGFAGRDLDAKEEIVSDVAGVATVGIGHKAFKASALSGQRALLRRVLTRGRF